MALDSIEISAQYIQATFSHVGFLFPESSHICQIKCKVLHMLMLPSHLLDSAHLLTSIYVCCCVKVANKVYKCDFINIKQIYIYSYRANICILKFGINLHYLACLKPYYSCFTSFTDKS